MSTIRVYDKNTMIFDHNGICALEPSSCVITRNLENYTYFLELTYPIYLDDKWKELVEHRIIHVKDSRFNEYFRIKLIKKTNEEVMVYAEHLFFDLESNFILDTDIVDKNMGDAISQILKNTNYIHEFKGTSDIEDVNNFHIENKNVISALIASEDSLLSTWGVGELNMSRFRFQINKRIGTDSGYEISYGKNLNSIQCELDMSEVVTRIFPVGFDGLKLSSGAEFIDSPYIDKYSYPIIKQINYENVKWMGSENYPCKNIFKDSDFSTRLVNSKWEIVNENYVWERIEKDNNYVRLETSDSIVGIQQKVRTVADTIYYFKAKLTLEEGAFCTVRVKQKSTLKYFHSDECYDRKNKLFSFRFNSLINSEVDGDTEILIYANPTKGTSGKYIRIYNAVVCIADSTGNGDYIYTSLESAQKKLRELARLEYSEKQIDVPKSTFDINFVELSKTNEYKNYKKLANLNIGDTVTITHEKMGINLTPRVVEYKYNCVTENFDNVTLGDYKKDFFTKNNVTRR